MWTKNNWVVLTFRINLIIIPFLILPLRAVGEVIEGVHDIVSLFRPLTKLALPFIDIADGVLDEFRRYGVLDLVDVDVKTKQHRVSVKILLR